MKVREMIQWLSQFPDQDAEVEVVVHSAGNGYHVQGGTVEAESFDPEEHVDYVDYRDNRFVPSDDPMKNVRTLLLGVMNG